MHHAMITATPIVKDVVLLGGGHSHVIVIRRWAMQPIAGVRLTLISEEPLTPYSGMLPGLIAGNYTHTESHIDLVRLCSWGGVRHIVAQATGVDADNQCIQLRARPPIEYDILSIDTGGAPRLTNVIGAAEYTTPVKPVANFYARWQLLERRFGPATQAMQIAVVGAGAGGFEIALAVNHRLQSLCNSNNVKHKIHWIIRDQILPEFPPSAQKAAAIACGRAGVEVHRGFDVIAVTANSITARAGQILKVDDVLWCTAAQAAAWPAQSTLGCDDSGFITINDGLQSTSHHNVFAAGDVAAQINHPRPRAGVFAVRQGPVLFENLQRAMLQQPLKQYQPQQRFLTLLSTGDRHAIATRGAVSISGKWVWQWKHWIDRAFMNRFNRLPPMQSNTTKVVNTALPAVLAAALANGTVVPQPAMRCGGCGAKVAGDILFDSLSRLEIVARADQLSGLKQADDVAVIRPQQPLLAQSVDQLRSFISDPWQFARIATIHALSDLYAAAATPQSAMLIAALPYAADAIVRRDLQQLMAAVTHELGLVNCALSGGHTSESAELALGFVVNGYLAEPPKLKPALAERQYSVVLTKPLGIGVIMAAHMQALATATEVEAALATMCLDNLAASKVLTACNVAMMTDVTGFGLLGHINNMLSNQRVNITLLLERIPLLVGAAKLSSQGIRSSIFAANNRAIKNLEVDVDAEIERNQRYPLLFDPQTSGGLVALIAPDYAEDCIIQLRQAGYTAAAIIGHTKPAQWLRIRIDKQ